MTLRRCKARYARWWRKFAGSWTMNASPRPRCRDGKRWSLTPFRDKHASELNRQARAVNFVWNYCNEAQRHVLRWDRWLWGDLQKLTAGASRELNIHAHTIQRVCHAYDNARRTHKKRWLRWRGKKSLGWVPFNAGHVTFDGEAFKFRGVTYCPMHMRDELKAGVKIVAGSFNQDARGRWYLNVPVEVECATSAPLSYVGIDLA
jgi:putative transposase